MKKTTVTASVLFFLLAVTIRAEANFFVSDRKPCPPPSTSSTANDWQGPQLSQSHCPFPQKIECSTPRSMPKCAPPCKSTLAPKVVIQDIKSKESFDYPCKTLFKPLVYVKQPRHEVMAIVYEGSLKNNVERIAHENGWCKVIWKVPCDYRWVGTAKICGPNLVDVMQVMLEPFPVEITFYSANHVVAVTPRMYHA